MRGLALLAMATLCALSSAAQQAADTNDRVHIPQMIARSYGDSIVLRWAVDDAAAWMLGNKYGWTLKRLSNDSTERNDTALRTLNGGRPILPLTLKQMMARFDSTDLMAGLAAQSLYGATKVEESGGSSGDLMGFVYHQRQEQQQRQMMALLAAEQRPDLAMALGLGFVDHDVRPGVQYLYLLVSRIPPHLAKMSNARTMVLCAPFVRGPQDSVAPIEFLQLDGRRVLALWGKRNLSGYFVERSSDGGRSWRAMNKYPIYGLTPGKEEREVFGDSVAAVMAGNVTMFDSLALDSTYLYRVEGFDAFGDRAPKRTSRPFRLADRIPPTTPVLGEVTARGNTICDLQWSMDTTEGDVHGFAVTFSESTDGPWKAVSGLLPPTQHAYSDRQAGQRGRGYYRVFVSDTAGNAAFSLAMLNNIEDVVPPDAPEALRAACDTSGLVYIEWTPSHASDLHGYRLFAANQRDHEFVEVTPGFVEDTWFVDTVDIHSLTNEIFYYVVSVDNNFNYSYPSDTLRLPLPDVVSPMPCALRDVAQDADSATIRWIPSPSEDVERYFFFRRPKGAARWDLVTMAGQECVGTDSLITLTDFPPPSTRAYEYCIEAVDTSQNSSGKAGYAIALVRGSREQQVDIALKAKAEKGTRNVTLTWEYELDERNDHYGVVYRSVNDAPYEAVGNFGREEKSLTDRNVPAGTVRYYVALRLAAGRHSTPSNEAQVKVK